MNHMTCLQMLEIKVDEESDIKQLLNAGQIKQLMIILINHLSPERIIQPLERIAIETIKCYF